MNFEVHKTLRKIEASWLYVDFTLLIGTCAVSKFPFMSETIFGCPKNVIVVFILLKLLVSKNHVFLRKFMFVNNIALKMFVGIIAGKPSWDFTHPLGMPRGLKGLLHMLNAIVSPMIADLCLMLWFYFLFCFAKGLAKCKFRGIWWVPNIAYLDPLICIY